MMVIMTASDIKNDADLSFYGWQLRLIEIDEAIALLQKEREKCKMYFDAAKERRNKEVVKDGF